MDTHRDLLIIWEIDFEKLPPDYRSLVNPDVPLPADVQFFEVERTWADVIRTLLIGVILIIAGIALAIAYIAAKRSETDVSAFFDPWNFLLIGAALGVLIGAFSIYSIRAKVQIINAHQAGHSMRFGLFLAPDALLIREESGVSVLGRNRIQRIEQDAQRRTIVFYRPDGAATTPQITLPDQLHNIDLPMLWERVQAWWKASPSPSI